MRCADEGGVARLTHRLPGCVLCLWESPPVGPLHYEVQEFPGPPRDAPAAAAVRLRRSTGGLAKERGGSKGRGSMDKPEVLLCGEVRDLRW